MEMGRGRGMEVEVTTLSLFGGSLEAGTQIRSLLVACAARMHLPRLG